MPNNIISYTKCAKSNMRFALRPGIVIVYIGSTREHILESHLFSTKWPIIIAGQIKWLNRSLCDTSATFFFRDSPGWLVQKTQLFKWNFKIAAIFQDGRQKIKMYVFRYKMGHGYLIWMILASTLFFPYSEMDKTISRPKF